MTDDSSDSNGFVRRITSKNGLLSALAALAMVMAVPLLIYAVGTGMLSLAAISGVWTWVFACIFLMAATRLFGKDTLDAVQKARGGNDK